MRSALLLLLLVSGCFRTTITNIAPGERPAGAGVKWKHGFIHGLVEIEPIEIDRVCPNAGRWLMLKEQMTIPSSLLHMVTMGLYTPRVVMVFCSGGETVTGVLDDEGRVIAIGDSD